MREIYWPHRHNGRRDAQDITVIPYFRAPRARARATSERRSVARRDPRQFRSRILIRAITDAGRYRLDRIVPRSPPPVLAVEYSPRVARLSRAVSPCNFAESNFNVAYITGYRRYVHGDSNSIKSVTVARKNLRLSTEESEFLTRRYL